MTIKPSIWFSRRVRSAFIRPSSVINSGQRLVPSIVPPRCRIPLTSLEPRAKRLSCRSPVYPCRMPWTSQSLATPVRTTDRMAAFIPGASPPLVSTAIRFISSPAFSYPQVFAGPSLSDLAEPTSELPPSLAAKETCYRIILQYESRRFLPTSDAHRRFPLRTPSRTLQGESCARTSLASFCVFHRLCFFIIPCLPARC